MKILLSHLRRYSKLVVIALILAAINQIFSLLDPLIFRHVIDEYATKFEDYTLSEFIRGVSLLLLAAVGVAFVSRVAKNFQDYYVNLITQSVGADIYREGVRHSLKLPYSVFEDQQSGATLGKLSKVRTDVERLITSAINILFTSLIGFIFVIIYAYSVHWVIAPIYIATVPIIGIMSMMLSSKIKIVQQKIFAETATLAGATTESLRNIELVKSLGLAEQEINRLNSATGKILKLELKKIRYIRSLSFIQGTVINFLRTTLLFILLYLIFIKAITFGQFFSLHIYSFFLFNPLQELGNVIGMYRETEASMETYKSILEQPVEERPKNPVSSGDLESIEFKKILFSYPSAKRPALQDINFKADIGSTIAFVGPSGSGKTSLVKILIGLYQPVDGEILYNNISTNKIDLEELRQQIGFVTQDTQLFSGTIRENLIFVKPTASDEECLDVLNKAACQSLLKRADQGLDTVIGEGGVKVSGGEKQRLSIARALLRRPRLLVFDEATSALDSLTEEEITQTIRTVSQSRETITIIIAHRLSTVMHADKIFVLEQGKIVEEGKHQQLVDQRGLYFAMWRQQIGESAQNGTPTYSL